MSREQKIQERLAAATGGPWFAKPDDTWWLEDVNHRVVRSPVGEVAFTSDGDAEFIASAREDIPYLLGVIAELRACASNGAPQ